MLFIVYILLAAAGFFFVFLYKKSLIATEAPKSAPFLDDLDYYEMGYFTGGWKLSLGLVLMELKRKKFVQVGSLKRKMKPHKEGKQMAHTLGKEVEKNTLIAMTEHSYSKNGRLLKEYKYKSALGHPTFKEPLGDELFHAHHKLQEKALLVRLEDVEAFRYRRFLATSIVVFMGLAFMFISPPFPFAVLLWLGLIIGSGFLVGKISTPFLTEKGKEVKAEVYKKEKSQKGEYSVVKASRLGWDYFSRKNRVLG